MILLVWLEYVLEVEFSFQGRCNRVYILYFDGILSTSIKFPFSYLFVLEHLNFELIIRRRLGVQQAY